MSASLNQRLDQILPRVTSNEFLSGRGIGNEIAFYIFDYAPENELQVREHIPVLLTHIRQQKPDLRVQHVNLFDLVIGHLKNRGILDKALQMQREKGDDALRNALKAPLHESKLSAVFADAVRPQEQDLVLVSGVGSIWPLLRSHTLLSNLHPVLGQTPLVMFYPGCYDSQSLRLFGKLKNANYYRAFKLIP